MEAHNPSWVGIWKTCSWAEGYGTVYGVEVWYFCGLQVAHTPWPVAISLTHVQAEDHWEVLVLVQLNGKMAVDRVVVHRIWVAILWRPQFLDG